MALIFFGLVVIALYVVAIVSMAHRSSSIIDMLIVTGVLFFPGVALILHGLRQFFLSEIIGLLKNHGNEAKLIEKSQ